MVLDNRLEYGFIGYQVPPTPRGTRSARKKRLFRKEGNDHQMCAFELLATVAGELSLEEENSPIIAGENICRTINDTRRKEDQHADEPSEAGNGEKGSSCTEFFVSKLAPVLTYSECSYKFASAETLSHGNRESISGGMAQVPSSTYQEPCCTEDSESEKKIKLELSNSATAVRGMKAERPNLDDVQAEDWKPPALVGIDISPALVSVDNGAMLPSNTDHVFSGSIPACRDDVQLVIRDDDENSYWGNQPSTLSRPFRPQRVGDRTHRRIRKVLASKYWMLTRKLKDDGKYNADSRLRAIYYNRKNFFNHLRSQRIYPPRKRTLCNYRSISNSNGMVGSKCISSSLREGFGFDASGSVHGLGEASVAAQHTPTQSMTSLVKLKIKSFKVPELFIEIPETATVGSLKRTVMEAVTSILGGELQVGVVLQGKKIGDDNKTLLQTGISHDKRLNSLGFSLEPNPEQTPPLFCHGDNPLVLTRDARQPLARDLSAPSVMKKRTADALCDSPSAYLGSLSDSDRVVMPSPGMPIAKCPYDPRALAVVPQMNVAEALAVGPMRKSKSSEGAQRRIRRPFSVSEVESLVQAVEKLGTGRWRNVKLEAFEDAKHRTYVDLKDKWKTLVHTARLHPQQRRGEPVPQELLGRVLAAHAYWSQQQSKQDL